MTSTWISYQLRSQQMHLTKGRQMNMKCIDKVSFLFIYNSSYKYYTQVHFIWTSCWKCPYTWKGNTTTSTHCERTCDQKIGIWDKNMDLSAEAKMHFHASLLGFHALAESMKIQPWWFNIFFTILLFLQNLTSHIKIIFLRLLCDYFYRRQQKL